MEKFSNPNEAFSLLIATNNVGEEEDKEELQSVARSSDSDEEAVPEGSPVSDKEIIPIEDDYEDEEDNEKVEISKREKARLRKMQKLKKQKIQEMLDSQNASIDADMNNKGKGRLKYLLQQTELFAHFAKGKSSSSQKKVKGRGRHASKLTEKEEDEEYLKEQRDLLYMVKVTEIWKLDVFLVAVDKQEACWRHACNIEKLICQYIFFECRRLEDPQRNSWFEWSNITTICHMGSKSYEFGIFGDAVTLTVTSSEFANKYFYYLWWRLKNLSSLGQNLSASTYAGKTYLQSIIATLVIFALLIGNMQTYLQSTTMRLKEWRIRRTDTEQWMHHWQFPPELRQAVIKYDQYKWLTTRGVDEEALLISLPLDLQRDIKRHLCFYLVCRCSMLDAINKRLKSALCTEGTLLMREGGPVNKMLFIIRGHLDFYTTNGGRVGFVNSCLIGQEDFCGEELLTWVLDPRPVVISLYFTRTVKAIYKVVQSLMERLIDENHRQNSLILFDLNCRVLNKTFHITLGRLKVAVERNRRDTCDTGKLAQSELNRAVRAAVRAVRDGFIGWGGDETTETEFSVRRSRRYVHKKARDQSKQRSFKIGFSKHTSFGVEVTRPSDSIWEYFQRSGDVGEAGSESLDQRVIPLLPRLMGKKFFARKKIPAAVDLKHENLKEQMDKACGSARFFMRTGTCSVSKVGKLSMERNEIVENVMDTLNRVIEILPNKWKYVGSLHLKFSESLTSSIYQSVPDLKLKISVFKTEKSVVKGKKKKGRIHEESYVDSNVSEVLYSEENDECFQGCVIGTKNITDIVKRAVGAAETEARAAHAPDDAAKAAGDAAAELVKTAVLEEFKSSGSEEAAVSAAVRAATIVIDAAEVSRNPISITSDRTTDLNSVETDVIADIGEVSLPDIKSLAQLQEKYCIQCLEILGEYVEVLGPVLHRKGVEKSISLEENTSEGVQQKTEDKTVVAESKRRKRKKRKKRDKTALIAYIAKLESELVPVIMGELHNTFEVEKPLSDEREKQNEFQGFLCGCLQVIIHKLGSELTKYGSCSRQMRGWYFSLRVFGCRSATAHEEATLAIGDLPCLWRLKNQQIKVRMMLPMSVRYSTCGNYIYKGNQVQSHKENVFGVTYLGIQIFRYYFKCTKYSTELTMKTDTQNSDYIVEYGASYNYELWRAEDEEVDKEQQKKDAEEMGDAMTSLENRTLDSKLMMCKHATVSVDAMLEALKRTRHAEMRSCLRRINFSEMRSLLGVQDEEEYIFELKGDNVGVSSKDIQVNLNPNRIRIRDNSYVI